jgi:seryl-tRNA synthetase
MCDALLAEEEEVLEELGLHYQVLKVCTGDMPYPNRKQYDINTWFPGQNAYRETSSCSNCTDYQSRRLGTKVKLGTETKFVHMLNATAVVDRVVIAILENFQQADGSILMPKVLQPLLGFDIIKAHKL